MYTLQVMSVCNHVRPDRQTLLFSATFRKKIEKLAKDALKDPVRISQGITGQASEDVTQHVLLLASPQAKRNWLFNKLVELLSAGSVLVFVTKKLDAEQVSVKCVRYFDFLITSDVTYLYFLGRGLLSHNYAYCGWASRHMQLALYSVS